MIWIRQSSRTTKAIRAVPPRVFGAILGTVVFLCALGLLFKGWITLFTGFNAPFSEIAVFGFFPMIIALSSVAIVFWGKARHRGVKSN